MKIRVSTKETGSLLMEKILDFHSQMGQVVSLKVVRPRELIFVVITTLMDQLVSIAVIFQLLLSIILSTTHSERQFMLDCIQVMEVRIFLLASEGCLHSCTMHMIFLYNIIYIISSWTMPYRNF